MTRFPDPRAAVAALVAAAPLAAQNPVQPFAAGPRWEAPAPLATPWIARDVAFAAGDELVAAGLAHATPQLALFGAQHEPQGALLGADAVGWSGAVGVLAVAAVGDAIFGAAGIAEAGGTRARVARYAPGAAPGWSPAWTVDLTATGAGGVRLVAAADTVALAQPLANPSRVRLTALEAATGALRFEVDLVGATLRALDVDRAGERLLVLAGSDLWVLDAATGAALFHRHDGEPARAAALSGDGSHVALGLVGAVERLTDAAGDGSYAASAAVAGSPVEYPVALALADDGATLAAGWWDGATGHSVRLETWSLVGAPQRLGHLALPGGAAGPQNYVAEAVVTPDGRRAAFGLWGLGGSEPEVVLFDRSQLAPLLAESLPGSVYAVDLSDDGTRIAVARKLGHANVFGTLGAVDLLDTGERDLELARTALAGASTDVWLRAPGALAVGVLIGVPADRPVPVAGVVGALGIDPQAPWQLVTATAAGGGHFRLTLPIPAAAVGLDVALQGVAVVPGLPLPEAVLLATVVRPPVL